MRTSKQDPPTRRQFLSMLSALPVSWIAGAGSPRPRNILLLIADDLGSDLHCYGNSVIQTPNIDAIAARGVLFNNAFATVSSCSPSRSVMLTGLYNHTNGQYGLSHGASNQQTFTWVRSLPKLLAENGYRTGIIGKYHVAPPAVYPFMWGVDSGLGDNPDVTEIAQQAQAFFQRDSHQPFFLVIGYREPHREQANFANERSYSGIRKIVYNKRAVNLPYFLPNLPEVRQDLAEYYQAISRLDQGIGLVMKALAQSGKQQETLVIFISDNGMPFVGAKTNLYDPGIRLPLIIASPGQQGGIINQAMVSWIDIMPTILDWAGIQPPSYKLPGRSLLPILSQPNPPSGERIFASHTLHWITEYYPMRALRTRQYKYIWNLASSLPYPISADIKKSPTWQAIVKRNQQLGDRQIKTYLQRPEHELYDLQADPHELRNLAKNTAYAAVLAALQTQLREMMINTNDPWLATIN